MSGAAAMTNAMRGQPRWPGTRLPAHGSLPVARIHRPARTPGRGGLAQFGCWVLEFEPASPLRVEPLMGWTSSDDPFRPIQLHFPDVESAVNFAESQGWRYEVDEGPAGRTGSRPLHSAGRYDVSHVLSRLREAGDAHVGRAGARLSAG